MQSMTKDSTSAADVGQSAARTMPKFRLAHIRKNSFSVVALSNAVFLRSSVIKEIEKASGSHFVMVSVSDKGALEADFAVGEEVE